MNKLLLFEIISTICIIILGVIFHFTYEWSNYNAFVAIFSSINESIWEHLKLIFFPSVFFIVLGYSFLKNKYPNYLTTKTYALLLSLGFIIIFYYTYSGIIGSNIAILDILSFFISIIIGQIYFYKKRIHIKANNALAIFTLITLGLYFTAFTFFPPNLGIFK